MRYALSMQTHTPPPQAGVLKTVAPVAPGRCEGMMPEFVRPADAVKLFGIGKSTLADWIARGWIQSFLVRREGNKSGMRLISTASLRSFVQRHRSDDTPSST